MLKIIYPRLPDFTLLTTEPHSTQQDPCMIRIFMAQNFCLGGLPLCWAVAQILIYWDNSKLWIQMLLICLEFSKFILLKKTSKKCPTTRRASNQFLVRHTTARAIINLYKRRLYQEPVEVVHGRVAEVAPRFRNFTRFERLQQVGDVLGHLRRKRSDSVKNTLRQLRQKCSNQLV